MSNDTVVSLGAPARVWVPLTELLRAGARRLTAPLRGHVPESIFGYTSPRRYCQRIAFVLHVCPAENGGPAHGEA